MTLIEMKKKVLKMIEEYDSTAPLYTSDPDLSTKMNDIVNQIQNELTRIKKLTTSDTYNTSEGNLDLTTLTNFYQLIKIVGCEHEIIGNEVIFNDEGVDTDVVVYYYKYPTTITSANEGSYAFEVSNDLLEIMPYGIAADLLRSDISANYGKDYYERYKELRDGIDPRRSEGFVQIVENTL